MKIIVNEDKMKKIGKKIVIGSLLAGIFIVPNCHKHKNIPDIPKGENNRVYEAGEHKLLEVKRSFGIWGKDGLYGLVAPKGYRILEYDYDKTDYFHYDDYVYVNVEPVYVTDVDKPGTLDSVKNGDVLNPGEHVIVDIDKSFNPIGKFGETFTLETKPGYTILDYDYDKTEYSEYENITYTNSVPVEVFDKDDYGIPVDELETKTHEDGYYDVGEHLIVEIRRVLNPFWGKDEMVSITAPVGYSIVDYDYDKTDFSEYETITYKNVVPVYADENKIGIPVVEVSEPNHEYGDYEAGEHVLVRIDKAFNMWVGYNQTRELSAPEGYDILDYDYDKNDLSEYETYVYVNNTKVNVSNVNEFGTIIEKEESIIKELVP